MNEQGGPGGMEIDPADQWVLDPRTGRYELRLDAPPAASPAPSPASSAPREPAREPAPSPTPAAGGRRAARAGRRRGRQRPTVTVWAVGAAAVVLLGGGIGGYALLSGGGRQPTACLDASPAPAATTAAPASSPSAPPGPAALTGPMTPPLQVRVNILDGTGRFGAGQSVLSWLQNSEGVTRSTNAGLASAVAAQTTLQYAPNQAEMARRLVSMMRLPASALREGSKDAGYFTPMVLTMGKDFTAPGQPLSSPTPTPAASPTPSGRGTCPG